MIFKNDFVSQQGAVPDVFGEDHGAIGVDGDSVPPVLAEVNAAVGKDEADEFSAVEGGGVVQVVVVVKEHFALHKLEGVLRGDIREGVAAINTGACPGFGSVGAEELADGLAFEVLGLAFGGLARHSVHDAPLLPVVVGNPDMGEVACAQVGHHAALIAVAGAEQQVAIAKAGRVVQNCV